MTLRRSGALILMAVIACTGPGGGQEAPPSQRDTPATTTEVPSRSTSEIFTEVSQSLAFVATSLSTGSGILIEGDLVVTNAHVVWPFRLVDIVFTGGASGVDLPVVAVDWVADLALIDVSTIESRPASAQITPTAYSTGDTVFLIGFPAEHSDQPEPAVTAGLISRTRKWQDGALTFIQSDALISGGQSGGALVDESGAIIGITSLEVGDGFALALDVADVRAKVDAMLDGVDTHEIGDRWPDMLVARGVAIPPVHALDETVFVFDASAGDTVSIIVANEQALTGSVIGPDGYLEATLTGGSLEFTAELTGPHFAAIVPAGAQSSPIEASANVDLRVLADPDRNISIAIGSIHFANIDYPGDVDWFTIELAEGETVILSASSPNADMALYVGPAADPTGPDSRSDSDSGAGVIGADAELRYTAPSQGHYIVAVFDETQFGPGSYALRITEG